MLLALLSVLFKTILHGFAGIQRIETGTDCSSKLRWSGVKLSSQILSDFERKLLVILHWFIFIRFFA